MSERNHDGKQIDQRIHGIATALTFLGLAFFLHLRPHYFGVVMVSRFVAVISASLGIMGLSLEINKLSPREFDWGIKDFGIGLGLALLWLFVHVKWQFTWVNALIFPVFALALYGLTRGSLQTLYVIISSYQENTPKTVLASVAMAIAQLTGFIVALLQIVQIMSEISGR